MKKNLMLSVLMVAGLSFAQEAAAQDKKQLSNEQVPKEITAYINKHFSGAKIQSAYIDKDDAKEEYDINLNDGTELEFNHQFEIVDIESKKALPDHVVPGEIRKYVAENYPGKKIKQWSLKEFGKQKIELDNGTDLIFDKKGNFISVDK